MEIFNEVNVLREIYASSLMRPLRKVIREISRFDLPFLGTNHLGESLVACSIGLIIQGRHRL